MSYGCGLNTAWECSARPQCLKVQGRYASTLFLVPGCLYQHSYELILSMLNEYCTKWVKRDAILRQYSEFFLPSKFENMFWWRLQSMSVSRKFVFFKSGSKSGIHLKNICCLVHEHTLAVFVVKVFPLPARIFLLASLAALQNIQ